MICEHKEQIYVLLTAVGMCLEFYLGRTNKTKSGSILELVYNLLIAITRKKKE